MAIFRRTDKMIVARIAGRKFDGGWGLGLAGEACKYALLLIRFRFDQTNCDSVFFGVVASRKLVKRRANTLVP